MSDRHVFFLLNKIDLIEDDDSIKDKEAELQGIESRIKAINGAAQIFRCKQSNVEPKNVIGLDAFSLDRVLKMVQPAKEPNHPT